MRLPVGLKNLAGIGDVNYSLTSYKMAGSNGFKYFSEMIGFFPAQKNRGRTFVMVSGNPNQGSCC